MIYHYRVHIRDVNYQTVSTMEFVAYSKYPFSETTWQIPDTDLTVQVILLGELRGEYQPASHEPSGVGMFQISTQDNPFQDIIDEMPRDKWRRKWGRGNDDR